MRLMRMIFDNNGFTRAGLSGQDVEAVSKGNFLLLSEGKIFDMKAEKHVVCIPPIGTKKVADGRGLEFRGLAAVPRTAGECGGPEARRYC